MLPLARCYEQADNGVEGSRVGQSRESTLKKGQPAAHASGQTRRRGGLARKAVPLPTRRKSKGGKSKKSTEGEGPRSCVRGLRSLAGPSGGELWSGGDSMAREAGTFRRW